MLHLAGQFGHIGALNAVLDALATGQGGSSHVTADGQAPGMPAAAAAATAQGAPRRLLPRRCRRLLAPDGGGHSPFHLAARWGMPEAMALMLHCDVAVDAGSATHSAKGPIVPELVDREPFVDIDACTEADGLTAAHLAARWGHASALAVLARHGADMGRVNAAGRNPLQEAEHYGRAACVQFLMIHSQTPAAD